MLYTFFTNVWVIMILCAALVFCEMFVAKKWFTSFTAKIDSEKARRGANVALGIFTCLVLAYLQMYALCDVLKVSVYVPHIYAAAGLASLVYLAIEKVFTESEVNALGKAFYDVVSHSDIFEGELTTKGAVEIAKKLFNITNEIDEKEASKQEKAVEKVVKKLSEFLDDGVVTAEEKAEAEKLIRESGVSLEGNSVYEHYNELLNK